MRKNNIEKRIREQADVLTPEPPSFDTIEKRVDWDQVAASTRPNKPSRRFFVPVAIAASALLVVGVAIGVVVYQATQTTHYGSNDDRPIIEGTYKAVRWECSDSSLDLSTSSLKASKTKLVDGPGVASLFDEDHVFVASFSFYGEPFFKFVFTELIKTRTNYAGTAYATNEVFSFSATPSLATSEAKTITASFENETATYFGYVVYQLI